MLSLISSLLLFIPGILLLAYIAKKSTCKMSTLEYILYGVVLWNYTFVSLSILIGLFSNFLREFYTAFTFLSLLLTIIIGLILNLSIIKRLKLASLKHKLKVKVETILKQSDEVPKTFLLVVSVISLLLIVNLFLVNYHSIIYEWDAVYFYIPIAKSLVISGHLSNILRDLNFIEYSPAIPIFYSFILNFNKSLESLYIIPSIFFVFIVLAIFELARKMGFSNTSFITTFIFISFPSVQIVLGSRSLYLDLPFLFYFIASLLLIIRMKEKEKENSDKRIIKILLSLSFMLLFLTRIEVSLFVLPTLLIAYLLPTNMGVRMDLSLAFLILFSVPILRDFRHLIFGGSFTSCRFINVYTPYLMAFAVFLLLYILTKKDEDYSFTNPRIITRIKERLSGLVVWSIFSVPALMYLVVNNVLRGGFIISVPGFFIAPKLNELTAFYTQLFGSVTTGQACFPCSDILATLTSWWGFIPLLGPISLGLLRTFYFYKLTKKIPAIVARFIWAYLGFFIFWISINCDPQPRRMFYFVPLASMIASYGVRTLRDFSWYLANTLYLIIVLLIIMEKYTTIAQIDKINTNIMHYVYPETYKVTTIDYSVILIFSLIYLLTIGVYFGIKKYRKQVFMIMNIVLVTLLIGSVHPLFSEVLLHGDTLKMKLLWNTAYYPEVASFYKSQSIFIFNQKTLCFACHELLTFTDGKFIDFTGNSIIYAFKILDKLKENPSADDFLLYLLSMNISYILIPTEQARLIQSISIPYAVLYNNTVFGDLIRDRIKCEIVGRTTSFYIVRLREKFELHQLNYSKVIPWIYVREKGFNFTIRDEEVIFQGYPPKNKSLGILFRFENPISLDHPIVIDLSWKGNVSKILIILYSDFSNRTTNFLEILYSPEERIVVNRFVGRKAGAFNEKHIEAIYIGLLPAPSETLNKSITLIIKGLYFVKYDP